MLDNGTHLFQFQGNNSNAWERFTGNQLCVKIRTERQGKKPHLCVIDEQDLHRRDSDPLVRAFCSLLSKPSGSPSTVSPPVLELDPAPAEAAEAAEGAALGPLPALGTASIGNPTLGETIVVPEF